ncbi:MAG: hypothetical protein B6I36_10745 [Desulfobacteraceae bacterium 4572_35.1]|nr:MAG: hypothetical protein B6I36_10745 [Desulfobacteraceae bacterium 4572_35.1]
MRSLFVKIFSSFILIIVLVAAAVVVLTYFRDQEFPPLAQQSFARQALAEYGRKAINTYEKRGEGGVDAFSRQIFNRSGIRLLLFDRAGIPLTHKRVPPLLQRLVQRALRSGEVVLPRRGPRNGLAGKVVGSSGESYFIAIRLPGHPPPPRLLEGITRGFLGWHLLLLLTVTATICFILARSLTAPISRLRRATREFAGGDLSVRIGTQVKGKNELVGLAHDFDEMAGKIEGLVDAQKILLRDISHELRSPLARLRIALELARQQESSATQQKSLNRIELEAERMNSMIGQLLDLTRLESGSIERPRQKINLSELLATVIADANFEAKTCGCQVVYNGPDQVDYSAIPDLLLRALENVIRNAVV